MYCYENEGISERQKPCHVDCCGSFWTRISMPKGVCNRDSCVVEINTGEVEGEKSRKNNSSEWKHYLRVRPTCASIKAYLKEYFNASGMHGVRYLAEDNRLVFEKLFWIIALSLCVTGCTLMIIKIREKLDTTPVMVTFAETATNVWNVPFPAVTICPETKSRQTFFNFTKYKKALADWFFDNITLEEQNVTFSNETRMKFNALHLVCDIYYEDKEKEFIGADFTIDDESLDFLQMSSSLFNESVYCDFQGDMDPLCERTLKNVWSEEGLCFTFNMLDDNLLYRSHVVNNQIFGENKSIVGSDWDPDKGYNMNSSIKSRPWRASGAGSEDSGFFLSIAEEAKDTDYVCRWGSTGYKIIIHSPLDMPSLKSNMVVDVPFDKQVTISLYPKYMTTSPGLENYDPHQRQCYFSHEKYLQHFQFYTQKNCQLECLTNETLSLCGCVPFYMPRNSTTKICGPKSKNCTSHVSQVMKQRDLNIELDRRAAEEPPTSIEVTKCDCLPSCVALEYGADTTQKDYVYDAGRKAMGSMSAYMTTQTAEVKILFKDSQFIATRRSELYGKIDFLANCGGILGLFSGFSIVSLIELVYFFTIRIWSNMYHRWKGNRSISSEISEHPT